MHSYMYLNKNNLNAPSTSIPPILKLASVLKILSQGGYQHKTGQERLLGLSQTSVAMCLAEVCNAIERVLCAKHIVFMISKEKVRSQNTFF